MSHWKPVKDWQALMASGVSFVMAKATEGNGYTDDRLQAHVKGIRGAQLVLGVYYHFARPGDPEKQAKRLISEVTRMEGLRPNERLALDIEGGGPTENPREAIGWIDTFFKTVHEATGRYPILYTSARIWRMLGNPSWDLAPKVDLWLPRWASGDKEPVLPGPWATIPLEVTAWAHGRFEDAKAEVDKKAGTITLTYSDNVVTRKISDEGVYWKRRSPGWAFWQWTDGTQPEHITPGIGKCDANWFRGSVEALKLFVSAR